MSSDQPRCPLDIWNMELLFSPLGLAQAARNSSLSEPGTRPAPAGATSMASTGSEPALCWKATDTGHRDRCWTDRLNDVPKSSQLVSWGTRRYSESKVGSQLPLQIPKAASSWAGQAPKAPVPVYNRRGQLETRGYRKERKRSLKWPGYTGSFLK